MDSLAFRHAQARVPNLLALAYTFVGWPVGVWLLTRPEWALNAVGTLLVAHTLVFSAYLIHDCAHNAIFAAPAANDRLGAVLGWINGGCLATYACLKEKHLRHHADRLDVVTFDYRAVLARAPHWVVDIVLALEWAYIPVIELLMRGLMIAAPFVDGDRAGQRRVIGILAARIALFAMLALISVKAMLLYAIAYFMFLNVLRFMDAFQHTYDVFPTRSLQKAPFDPKRTRQYEYENTYSNLVSVGHPWLDLLVLNFSYHNAHHAKPVASWAELPALHRQLYGQGDKQVMPCSALLASFHRHRVARVLAKDYGAVSAEGDRAGAFIGAVGVSFLTAV
jgi:fatty acid desaturase